MADKTDKTVSDACRSWLKTCERNQLERATLKSYRGHVRNHIEPRIGAVALTELSRSQVRDFMHDLLDDDVSQAQTRKVMASLRATLAEAIEREWIEVNVAADVKLRRGRRTSQRDKIIPKKEEIRLIMERAPESHRALFVTAILTGMRISELRGLAWEAVDFERRIISVRQRADAYGAIGAPKSRAGFRDIPMAPTVQRTLEDWRARGPVSDLGLVFPNANGKPQNYTNIYNRVFRPMMVELGIVDENGDPKFGIHALRHAAASLFIEQGWNPKQIQTLLGHASITMTMDVYGHLFDNAEEAVAMFEKLETDLMAA